jgi:hypothetical protein
VYRVNLRARHWLGAALIGELLLLAVILPRVL